MSTPESAAPQVPDQSGPAPIPALTDDERSQVQRLLSFPLDLPPTFVSWMEARLKLMLTADNVLGLAQRLATTGEIKIIAKDLTAETGLYPWEDAQGAWLYLNGASISGAGYADLEAFIGGTTLPDTRGRSLWLCGTNSATDLFDNDGVSESSRQPKHTHTDTLDVSGSPSGGAFLKSISFGTINKGSATGNSPVYESNSQTTGNPTAGTLGISGSVGSGMNGSDAVAHIVIGSALIKT